MGKAKMYGTVTHDYKASFRYGVTAVLLELDRSGLRTRVLIQGTVVLRASGCCTGAQPWKWRKGIPQPQLPGF